MEIERKPILLTERKCVMKAFFRFLASSTGRLVRAVAGLILIVVGIWAIGGVVGWIVAVIGLVPLAAGLFDRCVFAPLFGLPFSGPDLRKAVE
jgi:hypothetical protein